MLQSLHVMQFTYLHVFLSVVGLGAGVFVVLGFFSSKKFSILTATFIVSTFLTSLSGFLFPFHGVTPGIVLGVLSIIDLFVAIYALYAKKLAGVWRTTYVISACVALYFNFFVLVAQAFDKFRALHSIAPSQTSPGFVIAQLALLVLFILITIRSVQRFHPV
ncbi:MAG: hypothetical protein ABSF28_14275 [Terracidiphilus sp.]|jgi:hypothetical protein